MFSLVNCHITSKFCDKRKCYQVNSYVVEATVKLFFFSKGNGFRDHESFMKIFFTNEISCHRCIFLIFFLNAYAYWQSKLET